MEIKEPKPLSLKTKHIWTWVCVVVLLTCFYFQIFIFPWGNHRLIGAIALMAIIAICGIWINTKGTSKLRKGVNGALLILLLLGYVFLASYLRDIYIENQVNKYGVMTTGEVVDVYNSFTGRSSKKMARVAYSVKGSTKYSEVDNGNWKLERSDRLKLIYSSRDPDIFSIIKITTSDEELAPVPVQSAMPKHDRNSSQPVTSIDLPPEFTGGMPALYAYLRTNVVYPHQAMVQRISGKVWISFVINRDGSITDAKIEKGIGGGCDEAALHAVENMPNWIPGMQGGKPVKVKYNIPISFSL